MIDPMPSESDYPSPHTDHTFEKVPPVPAIDPADKIAKALIKRDQRDKTKICEGKGCKEILVNVHACRKYCKLCQDIRCASQKTASEKKRYSKLLRERARKATTNDQIADRLKYKEYYENKVKAGVKFKTVTSTQAAIPEPTYYDNYLFRKQDRDNWIPWEPEV